LVTQAVGKLTSAEVDRALASGMRTAELLLRLDLIRSVALNLQGETRVVGAMVEPRRIASVHERGLVHA
jgi:hypothetical protein